MHHDKYYWRFNQVSGHGLGLVLTARLNAHSGPTSDRRGSTNQWKLKYEKWIKHFLSIFTVIKYFGQKVKTKTKKMFLKVKKDIFGEKY